MRKRKQDEATRARVNRRGLILPNHIYLKPVPLQLSDLSCLALRCMAGTKKLAKCFTPVGKLIRKEKEPTPFI